MFNYSFTETIQTKKINILNCSPACRKAFEHKSRLKRFWQMADLPQSLEGPGNVRELNN
jgi:hypothetical protein